MTTATRLMTADEFLMMPDDGRRYELVRGELVELGPPPGFLHGDVAGNAFAILWNYVRPRGLGRVSAAETGFRISTDPDTVRAPDAAFVAAERLPDGELPSGYLPFAPDIVVEVVSPSDRQSDVEAKAQIWLDAGARLVWVVYPLSRTVRVHRPDTETVALRDDQALDGATALPGFSVRVSALFD